MLNKLRFSTRRLAVAVAFISLSAPADAQVVEVKPVVPRLPVSDEEVSDNGWTRQDFDFDDDELNFSSILPAGSEVATNPLPAIEAPEIARYKSIANIEIPTEDIAINANVLGVRFAEAPASAQRLCSFLAESSGFRVVRRSADPDLSRAQILGLRQDGERIVQGYLGECLSRGMNVIAVNFLFDIDAAATEGERLDAINTTAGYFGPFISALRFDDGSPPSLGDRLIDIPARFSGREAMLQAPDIWTLIRNELDADKLPASLRLLRRDDEDEHVGLIWLTVAEMREEPELREVGPATVTEQLAGQLKDLAPPEPVAIYQDQVLRGASVLNSRYRLRRTDGSPGGMLDALTAWKDGKLYTLASWSAYPTPSDMTTFATQLPGSTAFDLIATSLAMELDLAPDALSVDQ